MNKKTNLNTFIVITAICLLFSSCRNYSFTGLSTNVQPIRKTPIIQQPQIVSIKIDSIKVTSSKTVEVTVPPTNFEIENAKQLTLNQLIINNNADVVVEPCYEINQNGNELTVKVRGYVGVYKSFRPVENKDLEMIETINKADNIGVVRLESHKVVTNEPPKKKFNLGALILSVLIVIGIIALVGVVTK